MTYKRIVNIYPLFEIFDKLSTFIVFETKSQLSSDDTTSSKIVIMSVPLIISIAP